MGLFRATAIAYAMVAGLFVHGFAVGQESPAHPSSAATVVGTITDVNGGVVPDAAVVLSNTTADRQLTTTSDSNGFFQLTNVPTGVDWHATVRAQGFADWTSQKVVLIPGQYLILPSIQLRLAVVQVTVAALTTDQVATQEVRAEEKQRILGVVPNFYVVYDRHPAPMSAKLKFQLAMKSLTDPVTLAGFVGNATIYQAAHYPNYREGMAGYGQRLGSTFAGGYTNVLVADALLPTVLHQDPRYYYQGTGTTRSRVLHAISYPILTYGDHGNREINFSGIGGDLASGAVANAYYPNSQRGARLVLNSALIGAGGRIANGLLQEFVLKRSSSRSGKR